SPPSRLRCGPPTSTTARSAKSTPAPTRPPRASTTPSATSPPTPSPPRRRVRTTSACRASTSASTPHRVWRGTRATSPPLPTSASWRPDHDSRHRHQQARHHPPRPAHQDRRRHRMGRRRLPPRHPRRSSHLPTHPPRPHPPLSTTAKGPGQPNRHRVYPPRGRPFVVPPRGTHAPRSAPPTTPRNNGQGDRPFDNLVVCSMVFELLLGFIACHSVPHQARCVASRAMTHAGAWLSTLSQYVAPL